VKPGDPMLVLIGLQKVEGSWSDIQAIKNSCEIHVKCPAKPTGKPDVFALALAIAILRKRFSDRESQWKMERVITEPFRSIIFKRARNGGSHIISYSHSLSHSHPHSHSNDSEREFDKS
jgi:hypothetical protein